jgi:hypothetical protein
MFGLLYVIGFSGMSLLACDPTLTAFKINSQGFSPSPPIAGQDATLWIDFTVPDGSAVTAGTAKYGISFNGIPFSPTTEDLCTQVSCPIESQNLSSTTQWPSGLSGKIVSKIQWYDASGAYLLCSQLTEKV